jgi:hypothetical protein
MLSQTKRSGSYLLNSASLSSSTKTYKYLQLKIPKIANVGNIIISLVSIKQFLFKKVIMSGIVMTINWSFRPMMVEPQFLNIVRQSFHPNTMSAKLSRASRKSVSRLVVYSFVVLIASVFVLMSGCKTSSTGIVKDSDVAAFDQSKGKAATKPIEAKPVQSGSSEEKPKAQTKELIHVEKANREKPPEIKAESSAKPAEKPLTHLPKPYKPVGGPAKKLAVAPKQAKVSEADEVRLAALDIAKKIDTIKKIRICHHETEDEWWVTLYDDIGPLIDLKQYVWDRDSETLTPFLVLKRISKARYESQLTAKEPDKKCEVIDPPPKPPKKKEKEEKKEKAF